MALEITERTQQAIDGIRLEPQLVLAIEGVDTKFGAVSIFKLIRIGDPGLEIGDDWKIGGIDLLPDQADIISVEGSAGSQISQQLRPDQGSVSSISSVQVALNNRNGIMTRLISPGVEIPDILGAKATFWMGFKNTAFPDDFVPVFQGIIDDSVYSPGQVMLNLAGPDQLKRQIIFIPVDLLIDSSIDNVQTTVDVEDASLVPIPVNGPNGSPDPNIRYYFRVEDEIIRYTGVSGNTLTGLTRGELATQAVAHDVTGNPLTAATLVRLAGTPTDLALKIMLSGLNDYYVKNLSIARYLHPDAFTTVPNSIFFQGIDLNRDYGVVAGDYVTITDADDGANNCSAKQITEIEITNDGSYCVLADVSFVAELGSGALANFRSQFDTLGIGLAMTPDQVDVMEHVFWNDFQLANYSYQFVIADQINGKDFLDKEIYLPIGAYSLPRQGRASMGYHVGAIIRGPLKVLNKHNIRNPDKIKQRRSITRNFYNTIIYKFEQSNIDASQFFSGVVTSSADSVARIKVGIKAFTIESAGLRRALDGENVAEQVSNRYLSRYKFAAEFYEQIQVFFKDGFTLEPGDPVLFDPTDLKVPNLADGTLIKPPKVFIIENLSKDLKTGDVSLSLIDANFDGSERYGSISPSSLIVSGSTTNLIIQDSFGAIFPGNEYRKWVDYLGLPIIVHSEDWSYSETVTLLAIDPANKYNLLLDPTTPLSGPPSAGYIVDIDVFPDTTDLAEDALYKAVHVFLGASIDVVSGADDTHFDVSGGDIGRFQVGGAVRVHDNDYGNDSGEVIVTDATGTTVTVDRSLGFTPDNTMIAEMLPMPDGSKAYRIF